MNTLEWADAQNNNREAVMTNATVKIEAVPVERDEDGLWTHPAWPISDDEFILKSWFTDHGLDVIMCEFEYDAPEELVDRWFEQGLCDCSSWEPSRPLGDGWFIFSIHHAEDGPVCVWVRTAHHQ